MKFEGGCHCGNLRVEVTLTKAPAEMDVRADQCSFCRAHGALTIGDPAGHVRFEVDDPELVMRYRFASKTADFLVCKRCGVYVGAVTETPAGMKGIANLNVLKDRSQFMSTPRAVNYEGENAGQRIDRRAERWMSANVWF